MQGLEDLCRRRYCYDPLIAGGCGYSCADSSIPAWLSTLEQWKKDVHWRRRRSGRQRRRQKEALVRLPE